MEFVDTIAELEDLYAEPVNPLAIDKVTQRLTPCYARWIEASRFCVLSTVGPGGTDASPRGDIGPVVRALDAETLALPDWRGNNRLDSLRNIVEDGRVSLLFMVPGATNVVRVNGAARLTKDADLRAAFERDGKAPKAIILVRTAEIYFQCAKAILRSELWSGADDRDAVPTAGDFIREFKAGFDAETYDNGYLEYAKPRFW